MIRPALLADGFWDELAARVAVWLIALIVTGVFSFTVGRWWGRRAARREWERKEFLGRINVSLNILAEGKLKIRTIMERTLDEVFQNAVAVEKVREASRKVTPENPFLPMAKEDRWYLLNFVLNAVAEHFTAGLVRKDAGEPVRAVTYAISLTCELVGDERIRKVRAMLLREDLLREFPYVTTMPELEREWHAVRVDTLRRAAELYRREPDNFLLMELYV
ncbi:MAG TPA: hypothetical protein VIL46_16070 [Gemmataceae bacterium]